MRIDPAPILKPFIGDELVTNQGWIQWLSSVGESLEGEWFNGTRKSIGSLPENTAHFCIYGGAMNVFILFSNNGAFSGSFFELPYKVYDGQYMSLFVDGVETKVKIVDNKLNLSDTSFVSAEIQGTLLLKRV